MISKLQDPWAVAIVIPKEDGSGTQLHCSGSILGKKFVLTAAHCFVGDFPPPKEAMTIIGPVNFHIFSLYKML